MFNLTDVKYWLILVILLTCVISLPIYAQDEHTVLLYTFETGQGDIVKDLSEYKNNGTPMGPKRGDGKVRQGLVSVETKPKTLWKFLIAIVLIWLTVLPWRCGFT